MLVIFDGSYFQIVGMLVALVILTCFLLFFIHLKLELLPQFQAFKPNKTQLNDHLKLEIAGAIPAVNERK